MTVYVDASVLIPLFVTDPHNVRAARAMGNLNADVIVSDFAAAEFASVIALRVRTRDLTPAEAREVFATLDSWLASGAAAGAETAVTDIPQCAAYLRRLDLPLRAPDAIHIAIAGRLNADLLTFDKKLKAAAPKLGVAVLPG